MKVFYGIHVSVHKTFQLYVLLDNENYTSCPLYQKLKADIENYIQRTIEKILAEREGVTVKK